MLKNPKVFCRAKSSKVFKRFGTKPKIQYWMALLLAWKSYISLSQRPYDYWVQVRAHQCKKTIGKPGKTDYRGEKELG